LVVTADDFGADVAVNEAVERAHREGILSAAGLMVSGAAMADAVERARRLPRLGVGLHLVLVDGRPVLPPERVPDLVGPDGRFRDNMVVAGIAFLRPPVRRQLAAEIEAQFAAFAATGLPLDHVDAHKHFHLHPVIAAEIIRLGRRFGMNAVRAPVEPSGLLAGIEQRPPPANRLANFWARRIAGRLRRAGFTVPDAVFGLGWSGAMTGERLRGVIARLPDGLSEIYLHPATAGYDSAGPGYDHVGEFAGLVDPASRATVEANGVLLRRFADVQSGVR
jgi:hopanoid biosynthesis associated protein HpnK